MYNIYPFVKWAGGKRWLLKSDEIDIFPKTFNKYFEPFLGGGSILFDLKPFEAIISDKNDELINAYNAIKDNWHEVAKYLKYHFKHHSKEYYYQIRAYAPRKNTTRAAKFIYLNKTCFNGLYRVNRNGKFNVPIGTIKELKVDFENLRNMSILLKNYTILVSDFENIINSSEKNDFIFIDPPYTIKHENNGFIQYNEVLFKWEDQERLKKTLIDAHYRGVKFTITNACHNSINELYHEDFFIKKKLTRTSIIAGKNKDRGKYSEYVIKNF